MSILNYIKRTVIVDDLYNWGNETRELNNALKSLGLKDNFVVCNQLNAVVIEEPSELTLDDFKIDLLTLNFYKKKGYTGKNNIKLLWYWLTDKYKIYFNIKMSSNRRLDGTFSGFDGETNLIILSISYIDLRSEINLLNQGAKNTLNFFSEVNKNDFNPYYAIRRNNWVDCSKINTEKEVG